MEVEKLKKIFCLEPVQGNEWRKKLYMEAYYRLNLIQLMYQDKFLSSGDWIDGGNEDYHYVRPFSWDGVFEASTNNKEIRRFALCPHGYAENTAVINQGKTCILSNTTVRFNSQKSLEEHFCFG